MNYFKEELLFIKEVKQAELSRMEREHEDHLIDYPVLSQELDDVVYALSAIDKYESEMLDIISNAYFQTSSKSLYDTIRNYFSINGTKEIHTIYRKNAENYKTENENDRLCDSCMLEHDKQFVSTYHSTGETFCNDCLSEMSEDDV